MSAPSFEDSEMQEIFEGFIVETRELLDNVSRDLMIIEKNPEDLELLNKIFRSFHTIKGTSSFMGTDKITGITHHAEDILNKLRKNELKASREIIDVLLDVHDWIDLLVSSLNTDQYDTVDYSETLSKIEKIRTSQGIAPVAEIDALPDNDMEQDEEIQKEVNTVTTDNLKYVLENKSMFAHDGDLTDDEIALLDKAFNDLNNNFDDLKPEDLGNPEPPLTAIQPVQDDTSELSLVESHIEPEEVHEQNATVTEQVDMAHADTGHIEAPPPVVREQQPIKEMHESEENQAAIKHKAQAMPTTQSNASETIRVDISRVEALMDLSGELVLGRNRLAQISKHISRDTVNLDTLRELMETTSQIDFITSEIQATVMRMRMVQIAKLYQKAPRIVRDLSKEFNKKIKLVLKGEETEIDKGIIEELNDPLVHMIRNSCDHGIESAEERIAKGKPEEGTITLDAYQEGNNIVIKITDDGKGIDHEKLKSKAIEKGLITHEQASQMTRRDALQLIFSPGFSTAAVVSAVSGRGVGMDVVITNIQKLRGLIDIETEIGVGTTFTIKLPLTLAIIQGLLIKVCNETYAIPLSSVEEVVAVERENLHLVNQKEFIKIRDNVLPLVRLNETLKTGDNDQTLEGKYVVVVGLDIHRIGLVVDELLGQQEIVIKSVGEYLGHIPGIAGSTILGDGRVIMIIDIAEMMSYGTKN